MLLLLNRVFPVPVGSVTQGKEIKGNKIGKKEVKLSLFAGDRMPHVTCIGNPNKSTKTRINEFSRVARYKIHTQKLTHLYILITRPEEKLGKQLHL